MPAIVALVAGNFGVDERPRAYGLVMAAGAIAIAVGPLIGGLATTYASWRWVFAGEVFIVLIILALARKVADAAIEHKPHLDAVGSVLSAAGLGLAVFGVLRSGTWGWVQPKPDAPVILGLSAVVWLIIGGLVVLRLFLAWETRLEENGGEPLVRPTMLRNRQLTGGLLMFFFQYLVQMGLFFTIPLFLSVALGLSAIDTGIRILPLSITLLVSAAGVPKFFPNASPRLVVRLGLFAMFVGIVSLFAAMEATADATIVTIPLLLTGLGMGALASQLGSVTVSAVPDEDSPEAGGLQNTATNLGASLGTALAGSILIAALTSTLITGIQNNPDVPSEVQTQASTELSGGVPFVSDAQLSDALDKAGVSPDVSTQIVDENEKARIAGLRAALAVLAVFALVAMFFVGRIPKVQPGSAAAPVPPTLAPGTT
jgi:MFS family permease